MATTWQATEGFTVTQGSVPVSQYHDAAIGFDLTEMLEDGETIQNPVCVLRLLPEIGSTAGETEYAEGLDGSPTVDGNVVSQGVTALSFGRVYRLIVTFGASQNRRSTEVFLRVVA